MSEATNPAPARRLAYMPGVDGLRAIAVAAVIAYHLGASWLPGGYLGVDVFLVISGYLITSLLLGEHRATGRIDLARFWLRRARRLLPALLLMMAVVLAAMAILHPGEVGRLRGQAVAALLYVVNWHFIYADVPYFEQFGRPSAFLHLWSLAIEEQFYLVWPPLLALGLVVLRLRRGVLLGAVVVPAAAGSTILAWALWHPFTDPSRIYYGTDTRAVALLVGVALALLPDLARRGAALRGPRRLGWQALGLAAAGGVAYAMATLGDLDEHLYRGGFLVVALVTAALIAVAADATSATGRLLGTRPMVWLGLRSYAVYLWHWPVIVLTRPDADIPLDGAPLVLLRLALTVGAAALSYRYVEVPFRRHGMAGVRAALGRIERRAGRPARLATLSSAGALVAALVVAVTFLPVSAARAPGLTGAAAAAPGAGPAPTAGPAPLLFVGDSVMLGASDALQRAFGERAVVDARVGRRFPEGAALVLGHLRTLPPDTVVLIHLGNNYFVDPADIEALLGKLGDRRVFLFTVRVPLPWQDSVNRAVLAAAARHPNVRVVDWQRVSGGPGLLVDGAHMTERGMDVYTGAIEAALRADGSAPGDTTASAREEDR